MEFDSVSFPEPPKIYGSGSPYELTIAVNGPLELECTAAGVPAPTLSWLKDGRPMERTEVIQEEGRFLKISKVQVSSITRMNGVTSGAHTMCAIILCLNTMLQCLPPGDKTIISKTKRLFHV